MKTGLKVLGAALMAASVPWAVIPAGAVPLSESAALRNASPASVELVQQQRNRRDRAATRRRSDGAYSSYGAAAPRPGNRPSGGLSDFENAPWGKLCAGGGEARSANPSWACPPRLPY